MPSSTFESSFVIWVRMAWYLLLRAAPLIPRFFGDEEESTVGILHAAEQAEADDGGAALDTGRIQDHLFDLARDLGRALERSGVGQLEIDVHVAVIFFRQKRRRQLSAHVDGRGGDCAQQQQAQHGLANQNGGKGHVAFGDALESAIEAFEKPGERSARFRPGPQQQRRERGAERERVERRDRARRSRW